MRRSTRASRRSPKSLCTRTIPRARAAAGSCRRASSRDATGGGAKHVLSCSAWAG